MNKGQYGNQHRWAQLTKKLASLTLIRYFALFVSFAIASPLINYKIVILI